MNYEATCIFEAVSGIGSIADGGPAGKIAITAADLSLNGTLRILAPNSGTLASINLTSTGNLLTGPESRIEIRGSNGGEARISLDSCGTGNLRINGLVEAEYSAGQASIHVNAGQGNIIISGNNHFGIEADRIVTSGVRVFSTSGAIPGAVYLEAGGEIQIQGYGYQEPLGNHASFQTGTPISGDTVPVSLELNQAGPDQVEIGLTIPPGEGDLLGFFANISDESLLP